MNLLASGVGQQLSPFTTFLHSVPAIGVYVICVGLFLLLAKSKRLGGLSFRHVIFALGFGVLGALVVLPASTQASLASLATPGKKMTLWAILGIVLLVEVIMIIRDRRKGGVPE